MKAKRLQNKKGVLGLDTATAFVIALLVLVVMAVVFVIVLGSFSTISVSDSLAETGHIDNETVTLTSLGVPLSVNGLPSLSITNDIVTNATGAETLGAGNYTISAGSISAVTAEYNNTDVNVTYDFRNADQSVTSIISNSTTGLEALFASAVTWFSLLAVVIIILIIVIVIVAVRGLGGASFLRRGANL